MRVRVLVAASDGTIHPFDFQEVEAPALMALHDSNGLFAFVVLTDDDHAGSEVVLKAMRTLGEAARRRTGR